jgi:glyoxylase-like metal-dependent hydrolase (beta-lactamase superfamily II)
MTHDHRHDDRHRDDRHHDHHVAGAGRYGRQRRISRRMLFTDLGLGGMGVVILGACSGSSEGAAGTTSAPVGASDPPASDTPATDAPTTDAPTTDAPTTNASATSAPAGTTAPAEAAPAVTDAATSSALRLQHVSLGFVSAYVLLRGNEAAVVDTGVPGSGDAILAGLDVLGASWSNVGHIVLTHNHGDHVGSLGEILEGAPGATVYAGEADLAAIQSSAPLQAIGDGDEVLGLGVFNTPGHTAGSISLFDTETGILVAGDAINGDNGSLTGANPEFSSDLAAASASIAKLAALNPLIAAFGHGGAPITSDVTAQLNALAAG